MKNSNLIFTLSFLILFLASCTSSKKDNSNNAQDTNLEDIVEAPPEKKVNQAPVPKSQPANNSTFKKQITTGTFLLIEEGDYYYIHMKDEKNVETTFQIWQAYEGASELNVDNWEEIKGKRISVTWEETEEEIQEAGETMKIKKVLGVKVLN